jgi:hypothetical protein
MSQRIFVQKMVDLGLTAPLASQMLAYAGAAAAQTKSGYKPTKRGGGPRLPDPTGPNGSAYWGAPAANM